MLNHHENPHHLGNIKCFIFFQTTELTQIPKIFGWVNRPRQKQGQRFFLGLKGNRFPLQNDANDETFIKHYLDGPGS